LALSFYKIIVHKFYERKKERRKEEKEEGRKKETQEGKKQLRIGRRNSLLLKVEYGKTDRCASVKITQAIFLYRLRGGSNRDVITILSNRLHVPPTKSLTICHSLTSSHFILCYVNPSIYPSSNR
jgi:hypothetical protein